MGKAFRNPITGMVRMRRVSNDMQDFDLVDLMTRPVVTGGVDELLADPYFFRPVPLPYRTWQYHHFFRSRVIVSSSDENAMIRDVLSISGIDVPTSGGQWSPVLCLAPMALATAFTLEYLLTLCAVCVLGFVYMLTVLMNTPRWYRRVRLLTFPLRLAFMICVLIDLPSSSTVSVLGRLASAAISLVDIIGGDLLMLRSLRYACTYEVQKVLPNRVFVCKRRGADRAEADFGHRGKIKDVITGLSRWKDNFILLADIKGLIVELRPLRPEDWQYIVNMCVATDEHKHYVSVETYDYDMPDCYALEKREKVLEEYLGFKEGIMHDAGPAPSRPAQKGLPPPPSYLPPEL